jgi:hypothetical protein
MVDHARIRANPYHRSKSWWRVIKTDHGAIKQVQVNKVFGRAAGLWIFEFTVDDEGNRVIEANRNEHIDDMASITVEGWHIPTDQSDYELVASLAPLVGWRTAKAAVRRLRPGGR